MSVSGTEARLPSAAPDTPLLGAEHYRRQLETVANNATLALFIMDERQHCTFMNPAAERLTGYTLAEVQGRPLHDVVHHTRPDGTHYPLEECPIDRAFPENMREQGEEIFVHRDGSFYPVAFTASPIREGDRTVGTIIEVRDIQEEKERERRRMELEQALRASEGRYRALVEVSPQAVWFGRADGYITYCNSYWLEYTGLSMAESEGSGWTRAIHPDHRGRLLNSWIEAVARSDGYEVEIPFRRASDGVYRWFLARGTAIRNERGEVARWVGIAVDIHERKQAEEEVRAARQEAEARAEEAVELAAQLQEQAAELEQQVEETQGLNAELELVNEELVRLSVVADSARDEAEKANRAKSEFLANMSHELRTPLNAIAGYVDLLDLGIHGPVTEAQAEALARIKRSQHYLLALINDILNYAKLEAGKVEFNLAEVPLAALLADLGAMTEPQVRAKRLSASYETCDPRVAAWGDAEKIQQILLNLLTNAIKFTEPGGQIRVLCVAESQRAIIQVSDTGRGIPPEKLDTIFDPFVQLDRHRTDGSQQGVGLGLAISRDLARRMGGDLTTESTPGQGSTFTLSLPRAETGRHATGG